MLQKTQNRLVDPGARPDHAAPMFRYSAEMVIADRKYRGLLDGCNLDKAPAFPFAALYLRSRLVPYSVRKVVETFCRKNIIDEYSSQIRSKGSKEKDMKNIYTVAGAIAGIAIGSFGTLVLKAQKTPAGYYVAEVFSISNQEQFDKYAAGVPKDN
jgi:hypothetical protein